MNLFSNNRAVATVSALFRVSYKYDDIYNFSEGLAAVCLNDKWGYIDNAGVEVVPCKYSDCTSFRSAIAFVCDEITCKWGNGKDKH